jgi:hypothetical protein
MIAVDHMRMGQLVPGFLFVTRLDSTMTDWLAWISILKIRVGVALALCPYIHVYAYIKTRSRPASQSRLPAKDLRQNAWHWGWTEHVSKAARCRLPPEYAPQPGDRDQLCANRILSAACNVLRKNGSKLFRPEGSKRRRS